MDSWIAVVDKMIWPATVIAVVAILRGSLSQLIPTLKKLKYKELEVEFEREANHIRAEVERDIPEIEHTEIKEKLKDTGIRFSLERVSPVEQVIRSWYEVERRLYELAIPSAGMKVPTIRAMLENMMTEKLIEESTANVILSLAALRNKVVHADPDTITEEVSDAFFESSQRVKAYLDTLKQ